MEELVKQTLSNKTLKESYLNLEVKRDSTASGFSHKTQSDNALKEAGILECIQPLMNDILILKEKVHSQEKEIDRLKQKESKLMYLFFILHKKGVDVNQVYDEELKDVPTERFNEWLREHMDDEKSPEISFDSKASYEDI